MEEENKKQQVKHLYCKGQQKCGTEVDSKESGLTEDSRTVSAEEGYPVDVERWKKGDRLTLLGV